MSLDVYLKYDDSDEYKEWEQKRENALKEANGMKGIIPLVEKYYDSQTIQNN